MRIRLTKYNPVLRSKEGYFTKDDWTSCCEINKTFNGSILTLEEYLRIESLHVLAIMNIMKAFDITEVKLQHFCQYDDEDNTISKISKGTNPEIISMLLNPIHEELKQSSKELLNSLLNDHNIELKTGQIINMDCIDKYIKLSLREILGYPLTGNDNTFIDFGYDYYVYMGTDRLANVSEVDIPKEIFIEWFQSPYREDEEES